MDATVCEGVRVKAWEVGFAGRTVGGRDRQNNCFSVTPLATDWQQFHFKSEGREGSRMFLTGTLCAGG